MFVVESHLPKKFVWNPTFAQHDHQPLGCAVFDDVLKSSLPDGYSLSRKTFYQFAADSDSCRSILVITQHVNLVEADLNALLDLAQRGNKILIAASSFSTSLSDTLGFDNSYAYFNPRRMKEYAGNLLGVTVSAGLGIQQYMISVLFVFILIYVAFTSQNTIRCLYR